MTLRPDNKTLESPPLGLRIFAHLLLCSGCAINGVFVPLAIPTMAPYGVPGMLISAAIGGVLGVLPARWLANKIHDGISEKSPTQYSSELE